MINTIISGVFRFVINILDFFLQPIEDLIYRAGLGNGYNTLLNHFNTLMTQLRQILPWVVDATGIPKLLFAVIFGIFLAVLTLKLSIFLLKLILKWWDRIVA